MLNPGELQIDLFCKGLRIGASCDLVADARQVSRTRAGLGSGLELVLPGDLKDLWLNAPVEEDFVEASPYHLEKENGGYLVIDDRDGGRHPVRIPGEPAWYRARTSSGVEMAKVGVLQGTYLGIYVSNSCMYWYGGEPKNCRFCTTGANVGVNEVAVKAVADVVEVARRAKEESGVTFVHFNTGYQNGRGLEQIAPYVKAIKEEVGLLTGIQCVPVTAERHWQYDLLMDLGADHFSFCYEFHNPEFFARYLPGKEETVGQGAFFASLEYCQGKLPKGACSGEIIAGVEPIEDTLRAIDYITGVGAFPTVCIFRPVIGSDMEDHPSPDFAAMRRVMEYMYRACRRAGIPIGMAPNIEVSLIVNPDDAKYLVERDLGFRFYELKLKLMRRLAMALKFRRELRPHPVRGRLEDFRRRAAEAKS
ncbi:MAG: hypothetical protein H6807_14830 [Planctomycetes bacterium]|nr:hypothetical protein [Planctomycetota bacterium]